VDVIAVPTTSCRVVCHVDAATSAETATALKTATLGESHDPAKAIPNQRGQFTCARGQLRLPLTAKDRAVEDLLAREDGECLGSDSRFWHHPALPQFQSRIVGSMPPQRRVVHVAGLRMVGPGMVEFDPEDTKFDL
jgi:hypothetical protein